MFLLGLLLLGAVGGTTNDNTWADPCVVEPRTTQSFAHTGVCHYDSSDASFANIPRISIPSNKTFIVNELIPVFYRSQVDFNNQAIASSPILGGTLAQYETITDWSAWTTSLREKGCVLFYAKSSGLPGEEWMWEYELQVMFIDPFPRAGLSGSTIVFRSGYTGWAGDWLGYPASLYTYRMCMPPHPAINDHSNYVTSAGQFGSAPCMAAPLATQADLACVNCIRTTTSTHTGTHTFAVNAPSACTVDDVGASTTQCIMPPDCFLNSNSLVDGQRLYRDFIYQTHPTHTATWFQFEILHIYVNTNTTDRMDWTIRSMLVRKDGWGITLFEETATFLKLDEQWSIVFPAIPAPANYIPAADQTVNQNCTTTPSFIWPEACASTRTCANASVVYPVYTVTQVGLNNGSACDTSFTVPPQPCPAGCTVTWPSSTPPPGIDASRDGMYTDTLSIALLTTMGVIAATAIVTVSVRSALRV